MKHLFYTSAVILAFLFVSCNGNTSSNSAAKNSAAVSQDTVNAQNIDSTSNSNNIDANTTLESNKTPQNQDITNNNNQTNNEAGKSKTPVKPETPTDKLLKQYNEAMGALIDASKNGKLSEEATQKFMDLQTQLEELDNSGKLSTTQKELFKVTKDAYNMLKSKQ